MGAAETLKDGAKNEEKARGLPGSSVHDMDAIGPCHKRLSCGTINLIKVTGWCDTHPRICKAIEITPNAKQASQEDAKQEAKPEVAPESPRRLSEQGADKVNAMRED